MDENLEWLTQNPTMSMSWLVTKKQDTETSTLGHLTKILFKKQQNFISQVYKE